MKTFLQFNESLNNINIEEIDTKKYVSSSDFKQDFPELFGKSISGGYRIEGGHCLHFYMRPNQTGLIALADTESWTVGYKHPRGYGNLYGIWFIKGATPDDVDLIERRLQPLIREKERVYRKRENSLFPDWSDLTPEQKHMLHKQMSNSGHIKKQDSLRKADEEYTKYKTYWGQDIVKTKMSWD